MQCRECNKQLRPRCPTDPEVNFCGKACFQAYVTNTMELRLGQCLTSIQNDSDDDEFTKIYKIEIVLLRAILKRSPKEQLLRLKKIMMGRYVELIDLVSNDGDNDYLRMANASKKMVDSYDYFIEKF